MNNALTVKQYQKLANDLKRILESGRVQAETVVMRQLVETYWRVGERILNEQGIQINGEDQSTLKQLALDLMIDYRTLCYCQRFYWQYPEKPPVYNIPWSHYRELLSVKDDRARIWYARQAEAKKLSRNQLVSLIKKEQYFYASQQKIPLKKQHVTRPTEATYVYKAIVEKVVDGDTLIARIDLGFDTWRTQRLRLAQIDAPPLKEEGGLRARAYIEKQLMPCAWVMIRTNKIDIYGRYIADIFYNSKETDKDVVFRQGHHLNGDIVDKGLAVLY